MLGAVIRTLPAGNSLIPHNQPRRQDFRTSEAGLPTNTVHAVMLLAKVEAGVRPRQPGSRVLIAHQGTTPPLVNERMKE